MDPGGLLARFNGEDLTAAVVAAGRAGDMAWNGTAALRAGLQNRRAPAVGALAFALAFLGLSALGVGHGGKGLAFEFVEDIPSSVVFLRRVIQGFLFHRIESPFGGTLARLDVAVFAAG